MRNQTSRQHVGDTKRSRTAPTRHSEAESVARRSSTSKKAGCITPQTRAAIRKRLLSWYDLNKRDLPWRHRTHDPYAQWVAEIMLQQTRVETVIRYYERFLDRFPDVASLARADHEIMLKHWEGLGYYRRALNLHRAARALLKDGAQVPQSAQELRRLSGVGEYTAAAIASIAYGEQAAAVDGNVLRVIARLFGIDTDVLSPAGKRQITDIAQQLIPADRPGDFNQAWMDLANLVCLPKNPECRSCPLASRCKAHLCAATDRIPIRGSKNGRVVPVVHIVVALITRRGRILMRRRPVGGLWSGLWEPPNVEYPIRRRQAALRGMLTDCDLPAEAEYEQFDKIEHRLTHRQLILQPVHIPLQAGMKFHRSSDVRWVTRKGLTELAIPTAFHKVLRAAGW